jgi:hypothetical protein
VKRPASKRSKAPAKTEPVGDAAPKRRAIMIKMEDGLRNELEVLAIARHKTVQELGLEAICDLLRKHGRPVSLVDALRKSAAEKSEAHPKGEAKGRRKKSR